MARERPSRQTVEPAPVARYDTGGGVELYRIPLEVFPDFVAYAFLVLGAGPPTLVDVGSGVGRSNDDLLAGFDAVTEQYGRAVKLSDVARILITHGHIDHFGGLTFVRERCPAAIIGIHDLDLGVLTNFEERLAVAARELRQFVAQAGASDAQQTELLGMYTNQKRFFRSIDEAYTFDTLRLETDGPWEVTHVPGHCPGQVMLQIDDVLLSADHVLSKTTPHQAPETITRYTGLGHYLESLDAARARQGVRLTLGSHEDPIVDLPTRIDEIKRSHDRRLNKILGILDRPRTIAEISEALFRSVSGYHVLLALEEAGAHVEYLSQRNRIAIENLEEVAADRSEEVPIRYRRVR